jgi:CBS domain-containing protein
MTARDILRFKGSAVYTTAPDVSVETAAADLDRRGIGALPVVDEGVLLGVFGEREVVRAVTARGRAALGLPVCALMRSAVECAPSTPLREAMARLTRTRARYLVVTDEGRIEGIVSIGDMVHYRLREMETEANVLRDVAAAAHASAYLPA